MKSKLLLLLICFSTLAFAQDSTFQLKDYKYRTPGFRALSLNLYASGSYYKTNLTGTGESKTSDFSAGPLSLSYYKIKSTDKLWQQFRADLSGNVQSHRETEFGGNTEEKYRRFQGSLNLDWSSRYYKNGPWFFELGNTLQASAGAYKQEASQPPISSTGLEAENTVALGLGKGRIEWVQDAQMALYILNDLASQGLLNKAVTPETATAFAQLITDINNKRVFDFRRRRIYELTRIDSFFRSTGLVAQTDVRHFTTINDNWSFAVNPFRSSGTVWYFRLNPGLGYDRGTLKRSHTPLSRFETTAVLFTVSPALGVESYKPVSLKWQHNRGLNLRYRYTKQQSRRKDVQGTNVFEAKDNFSFDQWELNGFYGLGFFPNNRTQLSATLNVSASRTNLYGEFEVVPQLQVLTGYFLGYRSFLSGGFSVQYGHVNYKTVSGIVHNDKSLSSAFSLQLTHYLF